MEWKDGLDFLMAAWKEAWWLAIMETGLGR